MSLKIFFGLVLIYQIALVANEKAYSGCSILGNCYIAVHKDNNSVQYVVPDMNGKAKFKNLISKDEKGDSYWEIHTCESHAYWVLRYSKDTNLIWNNEGGCKKSNVGIYPEPDKPTKNTKFLWTKTAGKVRVCSNKCLYSSKEGKILSTNKCDDVPPYLFQLESYEE